MAAEPATEPDYVIVTNDAVRQAGAELLALCHRAFAEFTADYLTARLGHIDSPSAVLARSAEGMLVGFKLGYRRGHDLFYSWLGAVDPLSRRQGIARRMMILQHEWAAREGYRHVETRTRASNAAMIILNLRSDFRIVGVETDRHGEIIVTQRRALSQSPR